MCGVVSLSSCNNLRSWSGHYITILQTLDIKSAFEIKQIKLTVNKY